MSTSLQRYTESVEPLLTAVEKVSNNTFDALSKEVYSNAVSTHSIPGTIRQLEITLRRIVSARKELAIQANGLKPLLAHLKKMRR